jgi:hypothetical protein
VDWELAVPVRQGDRLAAVLNLEGAGRIEPDAIRWQAVADAVAAHAGYSVPAAPPDAAADVLVKSWRLGFRSPAAAVAVAGALARGGSWVLLVGPFPEVARSGYLTAAEAAARGLPLAECVHGAAPHLDVLPTGPPPEGPRGFEQLGGWGLVEGRYDFILHAAALEANLTFDVQG